MNRDLTQVVWIVPLHKLKLLLIDLMSTDWSYTDCCTYQTIAFSKGDWFKLVFFWWMPDYQPNRVRSDSWHARAHCGTNISPGLLFCIVAVKYYLLGKKSDYYFKKRHCSIKDELFPWLCAVMQAAMAQGLVRLAPGTWFFLFFFFSFFSVVHLQIIKPSLWHILRTPLALCLVCSMISDAP